MFTGTIVLIGAGNLAVNIGKALYKAGYGISQVYSRTEKSASALAEEIGAEQTVSLEAIKKEADLYIVSLTDTAFTELLPAIVKGREKGFFVHTAGSIQMDIWKGKAERYGVLYPLQTFSKRREVEFREIPFFLEARCKEDLHLLKELAGSLSEKVYEATSEQRRYLHLSAVFACNFVNHMYGLSAKLLEKHGLPFEALLPLIDETARKVHELPPCEAQTGPAVRYDENIIGKHLEMLSSEPEMQELYKKISQSIHRLK